MTYTKNNQWDEVDHMRGRMDEVGIAKDLSMKFLFISSIGVIFRKTAWSARQINENAHNNQI